ncbi:MAG: NAD(P)-dependent oxidoreductase [Liquorilactobacillus ghanensis]|uniref:NAD-dependent epimerase/dehydratase family protein n=1 Tax=Liquorilactobacillus ghanensis TaxID=399370 RepID=UPI0039EB9084
MSKVFVLGGTGFLGYYTVKELLSRNYQVKTMALPPMPSKNLLPEEVECTLGNIFELSDEQITNLLTDCDSLIYAAGADERTVPKKPAMKFFYEANVLPTQRLVRLAKRAGVKHIVVFNSYFAEFAKRLPQYHLEEQAYPCMRLLQEQVAFAEGEGQVTVSSLRLPYIFGTMPGRIPLWTSFVDPARGQAVYPAPKGGTAVVTVEQVAEAAIGILEHGQHRKTYSICAKNMKFKEFYQLIIEALGQQDTTQIPISNYDDLKPYFEKMDQDADQQGLEHGIHMAVSMKLQTEDLFLNPTDTMPILGIKEHDVVASIRKTLKKCVAGK